MAEEDWIVYDYDVVSERLVSFLKIKGGRKRLRIKRDEDEDKRKKAVPKV